MSASTVGSAGLVSSSLGTTGSGNAVAQLPNGGDILVAGYGASLYGSQYLVLAAYNPSTGQLDPNFGTGGYVATSVGYQAAADAITISGSNILVAGYGYDNNGQQDMLVAEYNASGHLVSGFGSGGIALVAVGNSTSQANALAVLPNGNIVLAGSGNASSGQEIALAELNSTGQPAAFGSELLPLAGTSKYLPRSSPARRAASNTPGVASSCPSSNFRSIRSLRSATIGRGGLKGDGLRRARSRSEVICGAARAVLCEVSNECPLSGRFVHRGHDGEDERAEHPLSSSSNGIPCVLANLSAHYSTDSNEHSTLDN